MTPRMGVLAPLALVMLLSAGLRSATPTDTPSPTASPSRTRTPIPTPQGFRFDDFVPWTSNYEEHADTQAACMATTYQSALGESNGNWDRSQRYWLSLGDPACLSYRSYLFPYYGTPSPSRVNAHGALVLRALFRSNAPMQVRLIFTEHSADPTERETWAGPWTVAGSSGDWEELTADVPSMTELNTGDCAPDCLSSGDRFPGVGQVRFAGIEFQGDPGLLSATAWIDDIFFVLPAAGSTPTLTLTHSLTRTYTHSPTVTPTVTPSATGTATPSATLTHTPTLSHTPSLLGPVLGQPGLTFLTSGWTVDSSVFIEGASSMRSSALGSWVEVSVTGPGAIQWQSRVQGNDCVQEHLRLQINGVNYGNVDCWDHGFRWNSLDLGPGSLTLRWVRDASFTGTGSGSGATYWLDDFRWTAGTMTVTPTRTPSPTRTASATISPTFSVSPTRTASPTPLPPPEILPGQAYAFPNPVRAQRPVQFRFPPCADASLSVFDLNGRDLGQEGISVNAATGLARWQPREGMAPPGVYFARVRHPGGVLRLRFVVVP